MNTGLLRLEAQTAVVKVCRASNAAGAAIWTPMSPVGRPGGCGPRDLSGLDHCPVTSTLAGLAVAAGAVVTYRTFRQNQLDQVNRHDREERTYKLNESQQVTDTYTKAVEQLGHDKAPVRLGAMYSLERLAQDNPPRRQTIVEVLCAYLRMPYTPSPQGESAADHGNDAPTGVARLATAGAPRHDPGNPLEP